MGIHDYTKGANPSPPEDEGLYDKFKVTRLTESGRGIDHKDCFYFVLDPLHDKAAFEALMAYINSDNVRLFRPALARDLLEKLSDVMQLQALEMD